EESQAQLERALAKEREGKEPLVVFSNALSERLVPIQELKPHPDEESNADLKRRYAALMQERAAYFEDVRRQLTASPERSILV
ncbi:hypothetical protein, partial [Klebsiella aerogenes]|uniref:hypothetical protein n=1 Tax=Klebsiella aerogenes TaxID=548 RepID=UPI001954D333